MSNRFTALILGLILAAGCLPLAAQTYTLQQLTIPYAPNASTYAQGINNRGAIVGYFRLGNNWRGFKRDANGIFESPIDNPNGLPYFVTLPRAINENGVTAGVYLNSTKGDYVGFLLDKGIFTDYFPQPFKKPTSKTEINGINNDGDFVGILRTDSDHDFASINGVFVEVKCPGGRFVDKGLGGIAADGTIVGTCSKNGSTVGYIRGPAGHYKTFRVPGAFETLAYGINNAAHKIVGYYTNGRTQGKWDEHGFVYDYLTDVITTVDWPAGNTKFTYPTGINSHGVIVGFVILGDAQGNDLVVSFIGTPQ